MNLTNDDLAAVSAKNRKWTTWNFAALWISMSLCIPTYMLASSLIEGGMNWWQAILTIFLGNTIVLGPMVLNGHAGAKYGIPFPILARASFGIRGANIPAILRAIVACGWFGIQTWIGGYSIFQMIKVWFPGFGTLPVIFPASWGLETGPAITFLAFWALNMLVVYYGVDSIRKLLVFKAIFLPVAAAALLFWAISASQGLGPILAQPSKFQNSSEFWAYFFPALTGMVGYWATLSLNIPDFTRYASSQRAQILGQSIGLPPSMTFFAFVGVAVTSATSIVFGKTIWDPVVLAGSFSSKGLVTFAMLAIALSTLATNIAANIVSPANDFAHLNPQKISFRIGGYITGFIGIVIFPWKLIADPQGYIFKWLIAYSSLLGPVGGIMIADYFMIRQKKLDLSDLYRSSGQYWYQKGLNWDAVAALVIGILPNVPGFFAEIGLLSKDGAWSFLIGLYHYAWFIGFLVAGGVYIALMRTDGIRAIRRFALRT
ncbi:MAG: NCS1 family nucleobase:cation symporter-1 [Bdellovibrionales bacterium]|nr:NCS1 family nucleobase:cation symporter-1 [Bdellovibrionales bacterium]